MEIINNIVNGRKHNLNLVSLDTSVKKIFQEIYRTSESDITFDEFISNCLTDYYNILVSMNQEGEADGEEGLQ